MAPVPVPAVRSSRPTSENTDDSTIATLSEEIARRIQDEMTYPGQVKITVIRETRSVSYAK